MGKNVILSEQTVSDLLEAYASLAAWYYQLWAAVRSANASAEPPDDAARAAFMQRLAQDYPELAALAKAIPAPRMFVPPPAAMAVPPAMAAPPVMAQPAIVPGVIHVPQGGPGEEAATLIEPAPARLREMKASEPPGAAVAPPPFVAPGTVKYDS